MINSDYLLMATRNASVPRPRQAFNASHGQEAIIAIARAPNRILHSAAFSEQLVHS